ncbi:MAG TPA: pyridoxal phosphate-dependent aminotransferase [Candidatus Korarchaeota archaeon]|nr:pyridoxal phosphate-dependent aminotransferase [Candidatus Korarchaeota archaeon]
MSKLGVEGAFIVLARAKELERQGKKIIHCEIGQPDFDTPAHIKEAAKKALDEGFTGYTPSAGIIELREAIAEYVSKTRGIEVTPDQVVVTVGAKIGIFSALMAFVNPGEEVIIPMPAYPSYESVTEFVGGIVKPVVLKEEREFSPSGEEIAEAVTDKTKVIVINTPSNPTGGVYKRKDLEAIVEVAKEHDLWIISDEIYEDIIFDGKKHESILSIPGAEERAVMLSGFSKTYAMTGWRLGYVVAPKEVADKITKIQLNTVSCPVSFVQKAGIAALKGPRDEIEMMVREYEERRDLLYREINRIPGFSMIKPAATFYAFPNVKKLGVKSKELATMLLEEAGVALLPGTDFGAPGEGYLRLSFATSKENLMEAMERIRAFVEEKFPNVS